MVFHLGTEFKQMTSNKVTIHKVIRINAIVFVNGGISYIRFASFCACLVVVALGKFSKKLAKYFYTKSKSPVSVACVHGYPIGTEMRLRLCLLSIGPDCHFRPSEESSDMAVSTRKKNADFTEHFFCTLLG